MAPTSEPACQLAPPLKYQCFNLTPVQPRWSQSAGVNSMPQQIPEPVPYLCRPKPSYCPLH
ncbi:hypothetical protein BGX38DRAFT_1179124 [Terfezia claveryi]|nr:hypothetical protein BGX38DRAFT_1179124 [Terfezia claveryi]